MVMGNVFSNCNGSSTFSSLKAVSLIKVIISNKEPLMGFAICLRAESHLYVSLAAVC
jgi:hypothetical protein